ncbi:hypothetical protein EMIT0158MI4_20617 [Burkholderia ambifaria]
MHARSRKGIRREFIRLNHQTIRV